MVSRIENLGAIQMTQDEHARYLGKLVANFQSLEFILRAFLQQLPTAPPVGLAHGTDIYSFPVGREVPENELTNFDSLGQLVKKFNSEMKRRGLNEIDEHLIAVRDALAHGRVSAANPNDEMRLLKFSKPKNGRVRVEFNEVMSAAWFKGQLIRVHEAILAVQRHLAQSQDNY